MVKNLNHMTELEITKVVFKGVGVNTPRGFRDVFSDEQIISLCSHPDYDNFSGSFKSWIWSTLDVISMVGEDK